MEYSQESLNDKPYWDYVAQMLDERIASAWERDEYLRESKQRKPKLYIASIGLQESQMIDTALNTQTVQGN